MMKFNYESCGVEAIYKGLRKISHIQVKSANRNLQYLIKQVLSIPLLRRLASSSESKVKNPGEIARD